MKLIRDMQTPIHGLHTDSLTANDVYGLLMHNSTAVSILPLGRLTIRQRDKVVDHNPQMSNFLTGEYIDLQRKKLDKMKLKTRKLL